MIHLFLDTTAFRDDPMRRKAPFSLVTRLSELHKVTVHLSEVTQREFLSQQEAHFDDKVRALRKTLKEFAVRIPNEDFLSDIRKAVESLERRRDEVACEFNEWLDSIEAQVYSVSAHHGASVVDKYFRGTPPFAQPKSRVDFPDAFIWEVVMDLAKSVENLHFVTNDEKVASRIAEIKGIAVYSSVEEFASSSQVKPLRVRTENLDKVLAFLVSDLDKSEEYITEPIIDRLRESDAVPMPSESEAIILDVGKLRDLKLNTKAVRDFGDGLFVMPFSTKTECLVSYFMLKADYWALEPEDTPDCYEDWNDHVFRIEEYFDLEVNGDLGFEIEPSHLDGRISKMKEIATLFAASRISVEELTSVKRIPDSDDE